ncbi:unnamed protein product [Didymodactylos carnosus]|uniref:J domain-containing protein n=1 Tax=Didymodactylos carnosus TaxID=1234261 RepID=A0A815HYI9_9BILA|nr:unnamed protein product [Didymodactylos carnosus]CAF1361287.1 unnamed protein product [Didymodactylos carnosus]CAF4073756.1 unnamed protein product [Didymodactylos carnosus]CAF4239838.1 unnamed protein product [Didymodactylos carnosus]
MLKRYGQLRIYNDPEIGAIFIKIKHVRCQIDNINTQIRESQATIRQYLSNRLNSGLIEEQICITKRKYYHVRIKRLKREQSEWKPSFILDMDYAEAKEGYMRAEQEYHNVKMRNEKEKVQYEKLCSKDNETSGDKNEGDSKEISSDYDAKFSLTEEERNRMKQLYHKTILKCHPDKFIDEIQKQQAHAICRQLTEAFREQNLAQIELIAEKVEQGILNVEIPKQNVKELLRLELRENIEIMKERTSELETIQHDYVFKVVLVQYRNLDEYFAEKHKQLREELDEWKQNLREEEEKNEHKNVKA